MLFLLYIGCVAAKWFWQGWQDSRSILSNLNYETHHGGDAVTVDGSDSAAKRVPNHVMISILITHPVKIKWGQWHFQEKIWSIGNDIAHLRKRSGIALFQSLKDMQPHFRGQRVGTMCPMQMLLIRAWQLRRLYRTGFNMREMCLGSQVEEHSFLKEQIHILINLHLWFQWAMGWSELH